MMEKVDGKIGEKIGERSVWLGGEKEGRKWWGSTILSLGLLKNDLPKSGRKHRR